MDFRFIIQALELASAVYVPMTLKRYMCSPMEQEEENGSDEAPEDVSLSQGKEEALRTRRVAALEAKK